MTFIRPRFIILSIAMFLLLSLNACVNEGKSTIATDKNASLSTDVPLPAPDYDSQTSVESALHKRRSVREYTDEPLMLNEVGQVLWAAQGITNERGYRTAPSAGALYPLELYLLAGGVQGLEPGVYKYNPADHALILVVDRDLRMDLQASALDQESIGQAPAVVVIAAVYERTTGKYGERGIRYVHMEVGSAAQNIYLQAVPLDLGIVFIGAFIDKEVKSLWHMPESETPLAILPIGRKLP